jgi:hypothetical protein
MFGYKSHQPFGLKISVGNVSCGQSGSSNRVSASFISVFRESGNGGSSSTIAINKDEANIISAPADMSSDGVYITVPTNTRFINLHAGCYWQSSANNAGAYRLEIGQYNAGSIFSLSLIPGQAYCENTSAATPAGSNVHLTVSTGLQRVGSGELITPGMLIGAGCYHSAGVNLGLNSSALELNYLAYELYLK